jgi:hypothetical protein
VGVILYEMLVGQPPFLAASPAETQYKVVNFERSLKIPGGLLGKEARDLILGLLRGQETRLGGGEMKVFAHICTLLHRFFAHFCTLLLTFAHFCEYLHTFASCFFFFQSFFILKQGQNLVSHSF